ncbi:MAG TPA: hypothetical protein PKA90_13585 [Ignavibacteria bacterium]|nr:hypothetical protein [Ignavibacteria bacterium]HMR41451.1 hypothetical protein [Ignavibacteria bacterium]
MEILNNLLSYKQITGEWNSSNQSKDSAKYLTLKQVENFEKIVKDDKGWEELTGVFHKGRDDDAWLALDWPDGFDELLLCVPLCKLVNFECSECTIGRRQENNSCAHDFSLFGYIAELMKESDRERLLEHIDAIKKILLIEEFEWDVDEKSIRY